MLDPFNKIPDALKAKPERLDAGFAVTFPAQETAEHGDSPDDLAEGGRGWDGLLGEDVRAFPLVGSEEPVAARSGCVRPRRTRRASRHETTI